MSYQNDSHKSGINAKGKGTTKAGGTLKASGTTKAAGTLKANGTTSGKVAPKAATQSSASAHGKNAGKGFQANDIKGLIHNQGRANLGGQEWSLKAPSWSDSTLQAIISDPKLTARPTGKPATDGRLTFELRGHGKTINVTIGR